MWIKTVPSRRDILVRAGGGFGALALAWMLERDGLRAAQPKPHGKASARSVIFLFMDGGPSHLDTFDPKPAINRLAGQPLPKHIQPAYTPMGVSHNPILPTRRKFIPCGQSGIPVSDWLPRVGQCIDQIAVIRSCWADGLNHVGAVCQMNSGAVRAGRPSLGSWVTYGLGSACDDLPGFVVMLDSDQEPPGGPRNWGTGFMPATYQGSLFRRGPSPILNLSPPAEVDARQQRSKLDFIMQLNRSHAQHRPENDDLEARIASYELAFRMQSAAPEAVDLAQETQETLDLYGVHDQATASFGRNCLLARRLVERGVRFVQLYSGAGSRWDAHAKIEKNHGELCRSTDQPIAALLVDLERRGLLDETLVVWGGEFGRTPMSEKGDGRDHNPYGFTMWMSGGGVNGGQVIGATDEVGLHAVHDRVHVHDLHATILHLMGLDHEQLTFPHNGLEERLTQTKGQVITKLMA
jgi:hypothetical protein